MTNGDPRDRFFYPTQFLAAEQTAILGFSPRKGHGLYTISFLGLMLLATDDV